MSIVLYFSSVSSNITTKKHQQKIQTVLDGKKIEYEVVDISTSDDSKKRMREIANDPKAVPPQIANGDAYCGDYAAFELAVEDEAVEQFLKL